MPAGTAATNVLRTLGSERTRVVGRFNPNGASDPVVVAVSGGGVATSATGVTPVATVTRTAQGKYQVRFIAGLNLSGSSGNRFRGAELNNSTATGDRAFAGALSDNSDGTVDMAVFVVDSAGAAQDRGPTSGLTVQFWLELDQV
jgi:hypothetical protein